MHPGLVVAEKVFQCNQIYDLTMANDNEIIDNIANKEYEFGFVTDIEMDVAPAGLNEETIQYISAKKNEPDWLLDWRLKGLQAFGRQKLPEWQNFTLPT